MKTVVCDALDPRASDAAFTRAIELLSAGEPVAIPTETVYGLAADATRPDAVARIFEAKERPSFDPLIIHIPAIDWLEKVAEVPAGDSALLERLLARFWPGPLTVILPRLPLIPDIAAAGLPTVAVRMSAHPVLNRLLREFGRPVAAPSANRFGRISPTTAAHVLAELDGRIPLVLDAGPCLLGVESTIIRLAGGSIEILRSGPVTREELAPFAPLILPAAGEGPVIAPGGMESHYAPRTPLRIVENGAAHASGSRIGLLSFRGAAEDEPFGRIEILSRSGDLREAAARFFAALRRLDEAGLDLILAERLPEVGLGAAIMDRLNKAAHV